MSDEARIESSAVTYGWYGEFTSAITGLDALGVLTPRQVEAIAGACAHRIKTVVEKRCRGPFCELHRGHFGPHRLDDTASTAS